MYTIYGSLDSTKLNDKDRQIKLPFHPSSLFKYFLKNIEDGVMLANAGNNPYTANQLVHIGYTTLANTNIFPGTCKL